MLLLCIKSIKELEINKRWKNLGLKKEDVGANFNRNLHHSFLD